MLAARERLKGRVCFGGMDLSSKIDITALALVFPPLPGQTEKKLRASAAGKPRHQLTEQDYEEVVSREADTCTHVLPWFWVPENAVPKRTKEDRIPYDVWVREGFINTTPGDVVDQDFIRKQLVALRSDYQIEGVAFDSWNATQISKQLTDDGIKMTEARQGPRTLSEPMKELMALVIQRKLEHYGNPVLTWMAGNVSAKKDPNDNIQPDKEKSKEKIDGIVAAIMAESLVLANPNAAGGSVYAGRGIVFI
jgi:phage terminase large subunit-like protein